MSEHDPLTCELCHAEGVSAELVALRNENEALKHLQQWKAIGCDSGSESDHGHWRYRQDEAEGDARLMRANADPAYDEVKIVTRWLSRPEHVGSRAASTTKLASEEKP